MDGIEYMHKRANELKERKRLHPVKKFKCKCGRKIMYDKNKTKPLMCGTCKTLGIEESKKQFQLIDAQTKVKIVQVTLIKNKEEDDKSEEETYDSA